MNPLATLLHFVVRVHVQESGNGNEHYSCATQVFAVVDSRALSVWFRCRKTAVAVDSLSHDGVRPHAAHR